MRIARCRRTRWIYRRAVESARKDLALIASALNARKPRNSPGKYDHAGSRFRSIYVYNHALRAHAMAFPALYTYNRVSIYHLSTVTPRRVFAAIGIRSRYLGNSILRRANVRFDNLDLSSPLLRASGIHHRRDDYVFRM